MQAYYHCNPCKFSGSGRTLDNEDVGLWYALNRLMTDYWACDHNGGNLAHEFYLPKALYAVSNNRFEGTEKIRAFYVRIERNRSAVGSG